MKNSNRSRFRYGPKDDVPIKLGYLTISFTFDIIAQGAGLDTRQAVAMSFTNLANIGQFVALGIIQAGAPFVEMAMTQLIVNLRYCLMSCSLSQKLESGIPSFHRFLTAYGMTNGVFDVSVCRPRILSPFYNYGLIYVVVPGWTLGALLGAVPGNLLPIRLLSALNVALHGILLTVAILPAKGNRTLAGVTLASMTLSFLFTRILALDHISSGFKIVILAITAAGATAILFPIKEEPVNES